MIKKDKNKQKDSQDLPIFKKIEVKKNEKKKRQFVGSRWLEYATLILTIRDRILLKFSNVLTTTMAWKFRQHEKEAGASNLLFHCVYFQAVL